MNFELLPNEIILDIFSYINSIDLLDTFYSLNIRFNRLLYHHYWAYHFDFIGCSKNKFDMICQQHLPFITNQVLSLSLANLIETPGQIDLFFSYMPSFSSFTHLRILEIYHVYSHSLLMKIFNEIHHLSNLTHLSFQLCEGQYNPADMQLIVNKTWNLPKLIYFYFDIHFENQENIFLPTNVSTSIKTFQCIQHILTYNQLKKLYQYTPYLSSLEISLDLNTYEPSAPSYQFLTLTYLNIKTYNSFDVSQMILFLQNLPNLHQLYVNLCSNIINGYQWEQVINNYLVKLEIFEFIMSDEYRIDQNIDELTDQLLSSFRSSFWVHKHKWFVQCIVYEKVVHLQSIPCTLNYFERSFPRLWKSTDPYDNFETYFDMINEIYYPTCLNQPISFSIHLRNVIYLTIEFPINNQFWYIIPNLVQLQTLNVLSYNDLFQSQLQDLLNHVPNLLDLKISQSESLPLQTSLFNCRNTSVRSLDLTDYNHQFNEEECLTLIHSSLGIQCQILSIQLKNSPSIITLIKNMVNLKALHIYYGNKSANQELSVKEKHTERCDEAMQWLKYLLPSTCAITKDCKSTNCIGIGIWIK